MDENLVGQGTVYVTPETLYSSLTTVSMMSEGYVDTGSEGYEITGREYSRIGPKSEGNSTGHVHDNDEGTSPGSQVWY